MSRDTRGIAQERIRILLEKALEVYREEPERSRRYVYLARRIAMRARIRIPRDLKRLICPECNGLMVTGESSRVRIRQRREPHISITCTNCSHVIRIPLRRKVK